MSSENPRNLIRSWNLQSNFSAGPVLADKLVPPAFGRIRTPYVQTWREQTLNNNLDWGSSRFSIYLPESLRVVSAIYLRIQVPANSNSAAFKKYMGIYPVRECKILSGGQEVYTCDFGDFITDYMESLDNEHLKRFAECYLGHQDTPDDTAREVLIPLLLPNSAYMGRAGGNRGHGVFPCFLGQNRLEIQITMNAANYVSSNTGEQPATIAGRSSVMYHQVEMTSNNILKYSDLRGAYSIINRRFTEITSGWTEYATANAVVTETNSQPQGTVTEMILIAVPNNADESRHERTEYILPSSFKVTADSIDQKVLDTATKVKAELWTNGFVPPAAFKSPGRLCFAAHASQQNLYSGGYNMTLASNVKFTFSFASACRYRLVAVQLQRVKIDSLGMVRSYLE